MRTLDAVADRTRRPYTVFFTMSYTLWSVFLCADLFRDEQRPFLGCHVTVCDSCHHHLPRSQSFRCPGPYKHAQSDDHDALWRTKGSSKAWTRATCARATLRYAPPRSLRSETQSLRSARAAISANEPAWRPADRAGWADTRSGGAAEGPRHPYARRGG